MEILLRSAVTDTRSDPDEGPRAACVGRNLPSLNFCTHENKYWYVGCTGFIACSALIDCYHAMGKRAGCFPWVSCL